MPMILTNQATDPKLVQPRWTLLLCLVLLAGCATGPGDKGEGALSRVVCDSYIVLDMCVRDLTGDGTVDMVYFSDTEEIFMYREGMKEIVGEVMPFHQCVVPLSSGMQRTTNRILNRSNMSLTEEIGIAKDLLANYMAAKPEIDACNARFAAKNPAATEPQEEFFVEDDWEN